MPPGAVSAGGSNSGSNRIVVVTHSLAPLPPGGLLARTLEVRKHEKFRERWDRDAG